ncbi:hypothetical protein HT031_000356 [Scenedesmus sp. PABB004]|nr:hypothetical protein HT031_000356 [Scenedesmus sp. PABB004]
MLYDGECSLCMKEVNFLRARDAARGAIDFVDIAAPGYDAAAHAGITYAQAMERIHAILPDGTIVRDVEVFRRLYDAVGLGWVYGATKNEAVLAAANAAYSVWARWRTQLTGRDALGAILARHAAAQQAGGAMQGSLCRDTDGTATGACELPGVEQQQQGKA